MDITKLVLLSFLISLSMCKREQATAQLTNSMHKWPPMKVLSNYASFNDINRLTDDLKQCFCYQQKPTGVPVIEKLKPDGEDLKRLVVYLYMNPTSNEIKLFVPNNEKQMLIPDLSYDEGDHLEAPSSENLQTVFTKYPDLVTERKNVHSLDKVQLISPIKEIKKVNVLSEEDVSRPNEDNINYDNKRPERPKNTRNPTRTDSDFDQIKHHNLNIDLNPDPYIEFEANKPNAPINVISVNINRKKADPNAIDPYLGNILRKTRPNRNRLNTNLDSNQDDVIINYPEDSELEESSISPNDVDRDEDEGTGDDNNAPDPEETIAENDFKDMPPELTDEMTKDETIPQSNRKKIWLSIKGKEKYIPNEKPNTPVIERHIVSTHLPSTDTAPTTNVPDEIPEEDSIKIDTDINKEIVPVVENESKLQTDLPSDDNQQPVEIDSENMSGMDTNQDIVSSDTDPTYDLIDYNIPPPRLIISPNVKPKARKELRPISIKVQKKFIDTLLPGNKLPIDYIKNEVLHNRHLIPGDLSIFSVHPETVIKKYEGVNGIDFHDTFDNWFDQQIKRVRFVNSRASNSIDIYTLKYLIEKTLHEKGMFVTEKGYIIDSDGHILKTANLGLRPILIGNSVEYKNLLQGKISTYKLPMDMPYLKAVLITSIDPPKILGIIPLGKTYLPKTIQKTLPFYIHNGLIRNGCSGVCNMRNMLIPSLNTRRHRGYRPVRTRVTQKYQQGKQRIRPYTRRIFPFDAVNTFIDKLYRVPLRETKIVRRPGAYVVNYETGPIIAREPVIKYPIAVSEVTPGFRIIGGNPATSSGTPVSSRGRSGYDSSETAIPPIDNEN